MVIIEPQGLSALFDALKQKGYQLIGPRVVDQAIIYDEIGSPEDLPVGWTDEQDAGVYRLRKREDARYFGYVVGPQSWKKFLHLPILKLWEAQRDGPSFEIIPNDEPVPKMAFIGVRSCELQAIAIQDRIFLQGDFVDPHYRSRRENIFIVAVNCTEPGGTCFCASMDTGPRAQSGYDLAITELYDAERHVFLVEAGSPAGETLLEQLPHRPATEADIQQAHQLLEQAGKKMGRQLETEGLKDLLYDNLEHPHWQKIAERCLSCANCTMVCPTCFCTTVEDVTDLTGETAMRIRKWDSCFTSDFSYIHGGSIRASTYSRYRQWMTHKLASWHDQFGTSGCVGCGRCITWCPVGIDITEEARFIRENPVT
ncbi:MAG: sulfite reductase subunit A [Calditrichaeota bacterium]|nr:sulfite reductase subunit A [Calditrichota bacterium]